MQNDGEMVLDLDLAGTDPGDASPLCVPSPACPCAVGARPTSSMVERRQTAGAADVAVRCWHLLACDVRAGGALPDA